MFIWGPSGCLRAIRSTEAMKQQPGAIIHIIWHNFLPPELQLKQKWKRRLHEATNFCLFRRPTERKLLAAKILLFCYIINSEKLFSVGI